MNKPEFYNVIRTNLFAGTITGAQVRGIDAILDYYLLKYSDLESLAYILATAYHESAHTMQAVREYGRGAKYDYGKMLDMGKGPGKRVPYTKPNQLYYGRGLVQITWLSNYLAVGKKLGIDLVNNPDLALRLDIAVRILVEGMVGGWFTGKTLAAYFFGPKCDAVGARRIINGTDKASLIAGYYAKFFEALTHATE
jgi:predicted chitinase